jgi:hypothetical protein
MWIKYKAPFGVLKYLNIDEEIIEDYSEDYSEDIYNKTAIYEFLYDYGYISEYDDEDDVKIEVIETPPIHILENLIQCAEKDIIKYTNQLKKYKKMLNESLDKNGYLTKKDTEIT